MRRRLPVFPTTTLRRIWCWFGFWWWSWWSSGYASPAPTAASTQGTDGKKLHHRAASTKRPRQTSPTPPIPVDMQSFLCNMILLYSGFPEPTWIRNNLCRFRNLLGPGRFLCQAFPMQLGYRFEFTGNIWFIVHWEWTTQLRYYVMLPSEFHEPLYNFFISKPGNSTHVFMLDATKT